MRVSAFIYLFSVALLQASLALPPTSQVGLRPTLGVKPGGIIGLGTGKQPSLDDLDGVDDEEGVPSKDLCVCPTLDDEDEDDEDSDVPTNATKPGGIRRKAVNLVLTALKLALKTRLNSYNTISGGFVFRAIDSLIPTDPTPIDSLDSAMDLMDPSKLGQILLDQVIGRVPNGQAMIDAFNDPSKIPELVINFTKEQLLQRYPGAASIVEAYDDPSKIPAHVMNAIRNGTYSKIPQKVGAYIQQNSKMPGAFDMDDEDDDIMSPF